MEQSLSRAAEALVLAAGEEGLRWERMRLWSHFQPIFSVRREACIGHEALVRAADDSGHPIPSQRLLEASFAARKGELLDWICRALHLRSFARLDPGQHKLFINVHPAAALRDARGVAELSDLIRFYGLVPRRVCVEILEDGCADDGLLREAVDAYRSLGAGIAMDGFGNASSNFDRVACLRPDFVKVDRAMPARMAAGTRSRRMLGAVIGLLHEAGASVVVDGIETASEALAAVDAGADHLQGRYFAAPAAQLCDDSMSVRILSRLLGLRAPVSVGLD